ncbi:MAG: PilZ domain-containing protein [Candidatus Eremiobacteraeota bacterium]|nr:PilZ domain-containing protein [Candidatus Eremiobacteraeota bacterium]
MNTTSILGDVVDWFLSRAGDRRQYKRRSAPFRVWIKADVNAPNDAIGVEISPKGLAFIVRDTVPDGEFTVSLMLRDRRFMARLKCVRSDQVEYKSEAWNRYFCEFTGIAADNWDLIVRYVNDVAEPVDRRKLQNQEMHDKVDDAYRLLPSAVQNKIVDFLVEKKKLERPKHGEAPLLKLFYGGLHKVAGKAPKHRINVHSRVVIDGEAFAYDTRFLIGDDGQIEQA